jgi:hypothetical protein
MARYEIGDCGGDLVRLSDDERVIGPGDHATLRLRHGGRKSR